MANEAAEHWAQIVRVAKTQHGVVRGDQLARHYSLRQRRNMVAAGRIKPLPAGEFAVAGHPVSWKTTLLAHCLRTNGCAHRRSAAALWQLGNWQSLCPGFHEVLVAPTRRLQLAEGVRITRSGRWTDRDQVLIERIPVTGVNQTLVDLALVSSFRSFRSCLNEGRRRHLTTLHEFRGTAEPLAERRFRGVARLRTALDLLQDGPVSMSDWSDDVADLCVRAGLPRPELEYQVMDGAGRLLAQVDLCWPVFGVVVELDGKAFHFNHRSFENDRDRANRITSNGFRLFTFTWSRYRTDSVAMIGLIRSALVDAGWTR